MTIWTNWDPLQQVIVGNCYAPGDMDWSLDADVRDSFNCILKETKEDLDDLANCLTKLGVQVHRPQVHAPKQAVEIAGVGITHPVPPIVPRDQYLVYGNTIYQTYTSMPDRYFDSLSMYKIFRDLFDQGYNWLSTPPPLLSQISKELLPFEFNGEEIYGQLHDRLLWHAATMFKCGDAVIVNSKGPGTAAGLEWMRRNLPGTRIVENHNSWMENWGHIDHGFFMTDDETVFCKDRNWVPECLRNKNVIEVGYIPEDRILGPQFEKWVDQFDELGGRYSHAWIERYLQQWKGYWQKVNFDTNVLVVDSKNVIFGSQVPTALFELLDKQGITSHVVNQRHGFVWEGGVHCFTLDVARSGSSRKILVD